MLSLAFTKRTLRLAILCSPFLSAKHVKFNSKADAEKLRFQFARIETRQNMVELEEKRHWSVCLEAELIVRNLAVLVWECVADINQLHNAKRSAKC